MTKRGAASGAARALALVGIMQQIDPASIDPSEREEFDDTRNYLDQLLADLLAHVHGTASPGRTPDLMTLNAKLSIVETGFYGGG